jgi:hypothetical protein
VTTTAVKPITALKREWQRYLKRNGLDIDVTWYSKTAWRERGEPYGNEAVLSLTFEGPLYDALNYGEYRWRNRNELDEITRRHGFFMEQGYAWSIHFYFYE